MTTGEHRPPPGSETGDRRPAESQPPVLQWNAGGWFGGQVGATLWMLIAAVLTAIRDLPAGLVVLALFAVPNLVGLALWSTRRLSCYASTQLLIGVAGLCGLAAVYVLVNAGAWSEIQVGGQVSAGSTYRTIALVFGGLMLLFYLRFGRNRR